MRRWILIGLMAAGLYSGCLVTVNPPPDPPTWEDPAAVALILQALRDVLQPPAQ